MKLNWVEECIECGVRVVTSAHHKGSEVDKELTEKGWIEVEGQGWLCAACQEPPGGIRLEGNDGEG